MRDWHVEHMQKTIVKFDYDIKHGVTNEDVLSFIDKIRNDSYYSNLQDNHSSMEKLDEVRRYVLASRNKKN